MINGDYELIIAPDDYPGKKYRERYIYEHHYVWWANTGEIIEEGFVIHHKNGNKRDNNFDNLELKHYQEHNTMHLLERGRGMVLLKCPCGNIFIKPRYDSHLSCSNKKITCCSKSCSAGLSWIPKKNPEMFDKLIAENVINEFIITNAQ